MNILKWLVAPLPQWLFAILLTITIGLVVFSQFYIVSWKEVKPTGLCAFYQLKCVLNVHANIEEEKYAAKIAEEEAQKAERVAQKEAKKSQDEAIKAAKIEELKHTYASPEIDMQISSLERGGSGSRTTTATNNIGIGGGGGMFVPFILGFGVGGYKSSGSSEAATLQTTAYFFYQIIGKDAYVLQKIETDGVTIVETNEISPRYVVCGPDTPQLVIQGSDIKCVGLDGEYNSRVLIVPKDTVQKDFKG